MIEGWACAGLDAGIATLSILQTLEGYITMAELRFVQGMQKKSVTFWLEAQTTFSRLFLHGPIFIIPPMIQYSVQVKIIAIFKRIVRFLFCFGPEFIGQHLSLIDAYLTMEFDSQPNHVASSDPEAYQPQQLIEQLYSPQTSLFSPLSTLSQSSSSSQQTPITNYTPLMATADYYASSKQEKTPPVLQHRSPITASKAPLINQNSPIHHDLLILKNCLPNVKDVKKRAFFRVSDIYPGIGWIGYQGYQQLQFAPIEDDQNTSILFLFCILFILIISSHQEEN
ncbi:MAG: hypothetical protein EZS28_017814 [Streblomastix strix]|uniref:Uncharacterized protein n=1 Tax=Streblomastix strix TaxID=222440 RepID=A0A5J4VW27_9EUKA|nr:MAG: hypothetical protein EZS28_017814 [Streblomastix strix]